MHNKILKTSNLKKLLTLSLVLINVLFPFAEYAIAANYITPWTEAGDTGNLVSGWTITGATSENTENGMVYWEYEATQESGGTYTQDFETGTDGLTLSSYIDRSTTDPHTGSYSLRMWDTTKDPYATKTVTVQPSGGTVSFWERQDNDYSGHGYFKVNGITKLTVNSGGNGSWIYHTYDLDSEENVLRWEWLDDGDTEGSDRWYLDDLEIDMGTSTSITLSIYSDSAKTQLVAQGTASALGEIPLTAQNGSGLSGTVTADSLGTDTDSGNTLTGTLENNAPSAPTLVSPADGSATNDTTPTLSATYSDSDTDDTGTTNYRISSSSLEDCTNNTNIVDSGTSNETATNSENTTYTPSSSIGEDGTYYWCAQNNDGTETSSWTQMASLILDTTAPTLSFTDNVTEGPTQSDTVTADWDDATVMKWDYDADGTCSETSEDYTYTDANSIDQTTEDNNGMYICLYAEDSVGNKSTLASANVINIDVTLPPTPTADPEGATYSSTQTVTLTSEGSNAIYYTTNGDVPTTSLTLYQEAITISETTTLKAIATDTADNESDVMTEIYTIRAEVTTSAIPSQRMATPSEMRTFHILVIQAKIQKLIEIISEMLRAYYGIELKI